MSEIKKEIVTLLETNGLNVTAKESVILLSMATESYQNKNDEHELPLLITITRDEHIILVIVPFAYVLTEDMNIPLLHEFFMYQNVQSSMVKFGFDPNDGEIQARVELITQDPLDFNHFKMAFTALHKVMESIHEDVSSLMAVRATFDTDEKKKANKIIDEVLNENEDPSEDGDIWL